VNYKLKKSQPNILTMGVGGDPGTDDGYRKTLERHSLGLKLSLKASKLFPKFRANIHMGGNWGIREKVTLGYFWEKPPKGGRIHSFGIGPYGNALDKLPPAEEERQTFLAMLMILTDALTRLGREQECTRALQVMKKLGDLPLNTPFRELKRGAFPMDVPDEDTQPQEAELTLCMRTESNWPSQKEMSLFSEVEQKISRTLAQRKCGEIDDKNWGGGTIELTAVGPKRSELRASFLAVLKEVTATKGRKVRRAFCLEAN